MPTRTLAGNIQYQTEKIILKIVLRPECFDNFQSKKNETISYHNTLKEFVM